MMMMQPAMHTRPGRTRPPGQRLLEALERIKAKNELRFGSDGGSEEEEPEVLQTKKRPVPEELSAGVGGSKKSINAEAYLVDRYKYAVRHIRQGLSVEEACNKYRIRPASLAKCITHGRVPSGRKRLLPESLENELAEWLVGLEALRYNDAIRLVSKRLSEMFATQGRPSPFNNGRPSMDWWYDFLSRHPQIMASKPEWLKRGKVNDQYLKDVQSGKLKCTKFRRALLSTLQFMNAAQTEAIRADSAPSELPHMGPSTGGKRETASTLLDEAATELHRPSVH